MRSRRAILSDILKNNGLTEFEKQVYGAVLSIGPGEARSYRWVAERIRRPNACRAVGNALNKNPYVGDVPCHRVIRSDGSIGGFARGASVKKKMLKREGVDCGGGKLL